jgi:xanthosine utilization system XapX-like protein
VRSPAPPAIALLGLLGMLLGGALVHAVSPAQKPAIALLQPDVHPVSSLSRIS